MIVCAAYARFSCDLQKDRSIEDQIRLCRAEAERRGWVVGEDQIYADEAMSGSTLESRPGIQALLRAAEGQSRPFDCVIVEDTSRLSRNNIDILTIVRDLKELGIFVLFVSDGFDTRNEALSEILLPVHGIKDSMYLSSLASKSRRGMEGQILRGYNAGGRTYGYKYIPIPDPSGKLDKKTRMPKVLGTSIEIDPGQAKVVRMIFAMYMAGSGLKGIATRLTDQHIDPPRKAQQIRRGRNVASWCPNTVRSFLRNSKYVGDWTWNKTKGNRKRKTGKRTFVDRPKEEWVVTERSELAIVDKGIWDAVQRRIDARGHENKCECRGPRRKYLLSGLLRCGICGANLIVSTVKPDGEIEYRCSFNWQRGAIACPNNLRVRGSEVEGQVIDALRNQLLRPEIIELIVAQTTAMVREQLEDRDSERQRLVQTRDRLSCEVRNLIDVIASDRNAPESIKSAILSKEADLARIDRMISQVTSSSFKDLRIAPSRITDWLADLEGLLKEDIAAARGQIRDLIGTLTARPLSTRSDRHTGMLLTGKPRVEGVLGMLGGVSNLSNGGGRI
ncbi:MAG: recombinase family protein [bacterium]